MRRFSISPITHEVCEGVTAIKRGGTVTIRIFNFKSTASMGYTRVGSIPADWVCSLGSVVGSLYHSGDTDGKTYVEVMSTGEVAIDSGNKAGTIHGTLTYDI